MDLFKLIPRLMRSGFHCSFVFFWDNLINIYTIRYKCLVLPGCSESRWALCAWVGPAEGGLLVAPWGSTGPALMWWGGGQLKILCLVTRHFFLLLMRDKEHYSGPPEGCLLPLVVRLALPLPLSKWQRASLKEEDYAMMGLALVWQWRLMQYLTAQFFWPCLGDFQNYIH